MYSFIRSNPRFLASVIFLAASCGTLLITPRIASGAPPEKGQPLERLVVVGDSLSAGFQNFSLFTSSSGGQTFGFAAVIAQQAGVNLSLPTISTPGIPPELMLSAGQIIRGTSLGSRTNPAQTNDLSVPGFTVANALTYPFPGSPSLTNPIPLLSDTILGTPQGKIPCGPIPTALISWLPLPPAISLLIPAGSPYLVSEAACAVSLLPSTVIVSIGSNDVLQALTFGAAPTPPATFQTNYHLLMETLALTRPNLIVSNIPDVTAIPFVVNSTAFQAICRASLPAGVDYVVPNLSAPTFNVCTENFPVTQAQITTLQTLVSEYNGIINSEIAAQKAHGISAAVVDINGVLKNLAANGYTVGAYHLTTAFLGGLFSLDGIHPSNTGYAILANAYIGVINATLGTKIPLANIATVAAHDPLIF